MKLIGVDVGGTFTDLVLSDTERDVTVIHKVPTTPADPSVGVLAGIRELCERHGIAPADVGHVFHGTTIATNAVLEYRGARTGMVTTKGYRDIIHVGRHQRPEHYSIMPELPWQDRPLVRRRHRKGVSERIAPPRGEVLVPLDEEEVREAARALKAEGVEAIAVCFLFSYLDPRHEERAREIIAEVYPAAFVTTSARVSPQFREFERFTTAAMNAFIGPKVKEYVSRLGAALGASGLAADLHIILRPGVSRGRAGRILGDHGPPSRHRGPHAGELRHRRRHRRLRRGAPVQGDQGVRQGQEEHGSVAHAARQHPRLGPGGG
jgi:N-methylhydantoinase A